MDDYQHTKPMDYSIPLQQDHSNSYTFNEVSGVNFGLEEISANPYATYSQQHSLKSEQMESDQPLTKKPVLKKKVLHRKKHKNSRLGCPQCKQRRIKCDEALPSCQKCVSRSIKCGYLDFSEQDLNIIKNTHIQIEFLKSVELEFQLNGAVPGNTGDYDQSTKGQLNPRESYNQYNQQIHNKQVQQQQKTSTIAYPSQPYQFNQQNVHSMQTPAYQYNRQAQYLTHQQVEPPLFNHTLHQYPLQPHDPQIQYPSFQQHSNMGYQVNTYQELRGNNNNNNNNGGTSSSSSNNNVASYQMFSKSLNNSGMSYGQFGYSGDRNSELNLTAESFGIKHDSVDSMDSLESHLSATLFSPPPPPPQLHQQPPSMMFQQNMELTSNKPHDISRFHTSPPHLTFPVNNNMENTDEEVVLPSKRNLNTSQRSVANAHVMDSSSRYLSLMKSQTSTSTSTSSSSSPFASFSLSPQYPTQDYKPGGNKQSMSYLLSKEAYGEDLQNFHLTQSLERLTISSKPIERNGTTFKLPLIPHIHRRPRYSPNKYPPFFSETINNVMARVYCLSDNFDRVEESFQCKEIFNAISLQGTGILSLSYPELGDLVLYRRGVLLADMKKWLVDMNDDNALQLLWLTSTLNSSSIFLGDLPTEEYIRSNTGSATVLIIALENEEKFPKTIIKLKNFADGLLFTSKMLWTPLYHDESLLSFADFFQKFSQNCQDPNTLPYLNKLNGFLDYLLNFLKNEKSESQVLRYPINKIHQLLAIWYKSIPLDMFTINVKTPPERKVVFAFWFTLAILLEDVFANTRYVFTFLFNGFYLIYPFAVETMNVGLSQDLQRAINYCYRMMAFLIRRRSLLTRTKFINDDFTNTKYLQDFKNNVQTKVISNVQELFIINFQKTLIKPENYPRDKTPEELLQNNNLIDKSDDLELNFLDCNLETGLLNVDYDPRFVDPVFNKNLKFQCATVDFLKGFLNDRKTLIELSQEI